MTAKAYIFAIIGVVVLLLLMFYIGRETSPVEKEYIVKKVFEIDTVRVPDTIRITPEPIYINTSAKVVYRTDTLYQTQAFRASIDTLVSKDTVMIDFYFPENSFVVDIRKGELEIPIEYVEIHSKELIEEERAWWELPAAITGGLLIGVFIGSNAK